MEKKFILDVGAGLKNGISNILSNGTVNTDAVTNTESNVSIIEIVNQEELARHLDKADLIFVDSGVPLNVSGSLQLEKTNGLLDYRPIIIVPGGETSKNKAIFEQVLSACFEHSLSRTSTIAVIGGGALCDTISYVASVFMRGISVILVPSTLLSIVDASIGGKTAINYATYKNMVGTFYLPKLVAVAPFLLATLDSAQLKEGLAEIIKAGMLVDATIIKTIESYAGNLLKGNYNAHAQVWNELIIKSIKVKLDIVQKDFKEANIRAHLNLGHTFAHAHETCAKNKGLSVAHGVAVALGLRAALLLGLCIDKTNLKYRKASTKDNLVRMAYTNKTYAERIFYLLEQLEYPNNYKGYDAHEMLKIMKMDKKTSKNTLNFVLQADLNNTEKLAIASEAVLQVLTELGAE